MVSVNIALVRRTNYQPSGTSGIRYQIGLFLLLCLKFSACCPDCCSACSDRVRWERSYKSLPSFTSGMSDCQNFDINWLFKTLLLRRQTCPVCPLNFSFWTFYLLSPDWPQGQACIICCSQQTVRWSLSSGQSWEGKYSTLEEENLPPVTGGSRGQMSE